MARAKVGTVQVTTWKGRKTRVIRRIKVMDPVTGRTKWKHLGKHLYETHIGKLPEGMVATFDTADANDTSLENLTLARPGDMWLLAEERDPGVAVRRARNHGKAMKRMAKELTEVRAVAGWRPWWWYPVCDEQRCHLNEPCRSKRRLEATLPPGWRAVQGRELQSGEEFRWYERVTREKAGFHEAN